MHLRHAVLRIAQGGPLAEKALVRVQELVQRVTNGPLVRAG